MYSQPSGLAQGIADAEEQDGKPKPALHNISFVVRKVGSVVGLHCFAEHRISSLQGSILAHSSASSGPRLEPYGLGPWEKTCTMAGSMSQSKP